MFSSLKRFKRASAACVALGSLIVSGEALAGGTIPGQSIDNTASVNYSVGGVPQTVIRSAPGAGNSTPGTPGTPTSFVVDQKVDLYMREVNSAATSVIPGSTNQVTTFFIRNDGNAAQGVNLSQALYAGAVFGNSSSAVLLTNVRRFVESTAAYSGAACQSPTAPAQPGGMAFTLGTDTAQNISTLAPDTCTWVYVVADVPVTSLNGTYQNVELTGVAREAVTLNALTPNNGADTAGVDIVFADPSATVADRDQYAVVTAAFNVIKASAVIDDFVSTAPNFKPIPGARVEYTLTLTNNGGATADTVAITDALPIQTAFFPAAYNGSTSDVSITVGAVTTFCIAEAGGADSNADGCFRTTSAGVTTLTVRNPAIPSVAAAGTVTVRFRVTIQ